MDLVISVFGDTCVAMQQWIANPQAGTAFDIIIQCGDSSKSSSHYLVTKSAPTHGNEVFGGPLDINGLLYFDQIDHDPLMYDQLLEKPHVQQKTSSTPPPSPPDPCISIRNSFKTIFTAIGTDHCPNLRKYTMWVAVGSACLSTGSSCAILLWMIFIRRANMRYRKVGSDGTKRFEENAKDESRSGVSSRNDASLPMSSSSQKVAKPFPLKIRENLGSSSRPVSPGKTMEVTMTMNVGGRRRTIRREDDSSNLTW